MPWQIFIFISVILLSIVTILQKVSLKNKTLDPVSYAAFFQTIIGITFFILGIFSGKLSSLLNPIILPNLIFLGIIYGAGAMCMFKALATTEASKFTIIFSLRLFFTILGSAIIFHQNLLPLQLLGTFLLFIGIFFISWEKSSIRFQKGDLFSFLCAIFFGIGVINDKILLNNLEFLPFLSIAFLLPAIFIFTIHPQAIESIPLVLHKKTLLPLLIVCLFYGGQAMFFYFGLSIAPNPALAAVINSATVITTVLLAIIFLKEKDFIWKKIIGSVISFVGLILLII